MWRAAPSTSSRWRSRARGRSDRTAKRNLTGVFQHWDCIDPDWNPGGIWRDVRLERTGPVRISRLRVLCRDADANANRAHFAFVADLDSDEARTVTVRTTIGDLAESSVEQSLAVGRQPSGVDGAGGEPVAVVAAGDGRADAPRRAGRGRDR